MACISREADDGDSRLYEKVKSVVFTCIRCYHTLPVDLDAPASAKVRCPECHFELTTGDIKFFCEALDDAPSGDERVLCEIPIPLPGWLAALCA